MICAYSIEDIDQAFTTSKLKGYSSPFIGSRPGMVRKNKVFLSFLITPIRNTALRKENVLLHESCFISIFKSHKLIEEKQY